MDLYSCGNGSAFLGIILVLLMAGNISDDSEAREVSGINSTSRLNSAILPAHFTERKITDSASAKAAINDAKRSFRNYIR